MPLERMDTMIYTFLDNGSGHREAHDSSPDSVEGDLRSWIREGDYGELESTLWVSARAWPVSAMDDDGDVYWGDVTDVTVSIDPEEPSCTDGSHAWRAPHSLVGGTADSVIIREVCVSCGCRRTTDTWAQRPDTGEEGLTSVAYHTSDEEH